jgi:ubiquinone/menaquinone biosynthesis C-methylase UbiE
MSTQESRVCPVEYAGGLEAKIRHWVHNPARIVGPYIKEGMTAMDVGCGPGYFSLPMAELVGDGGRVIAADLQDGMLQKVKAKIEGTPLQRRIVLHKCGQERIGVTERVDFVLAFYMVHEVPDKASFFKELATLLKPDGRLLLVEPPFHVSGEAFEKTLSLAQDAGLELVEKRKRGLDRTACLKRKT